MTDLHTDYLGLRLKSPIVASPSPMTGEIDGVIELERHGVGAIVLPSLFEEQIEHEANEIDRLLSAHANSDWQATEFFPEMNEESGVDRYIALVESAKAAVDVPVIASLNGASIGGWLRYGTLLEDAGADAIEVNLYNVAADPIVSSTSLESEQFGLIAILADELNIPLAVKISPFYSSLAAFLVSVEEAGAAGVVMFNRFYQPDLDLETLLVQPRLSLSTPEELRLPLRWTGIIREHLSMSIAASTGVHSGFDVAKLLLVGADVAMATSSLLRNGASHVATMEEQLRDWMVEHDYESVEQMRGAVRSEASVDPAAFERANYIGNLASYTRSRHGTHSIGLKSR
jgi:dihydroorotate dehydrogenase (fumarate)